MEKVKVGRSGKEERREGGKWVIKEKVGGKRGWKTGGRERGKRGVIKE